MPAGSLSAFGLEPCASPSHTRRMKGEILVLLVSVFWIALCMRFWFMIDREHGFQRRLIAIGAGVGGGLIYMVGTMMLSVLREAEKQAQEAPVPVSESIRIQTK